MVNLNHFGCSDDDFNLIMKQMREQCHIYNDIVLKNSHSKKYASYSIFLMVMCIVFLLIFLFFLTKYFIRKYKK